MTTEPKWPDDPAWIDWLNERLREAMEYQDREAEMKQAERREFWLEKTKESDPC